MPQRSIFIGGSLFLLILTGIGIFVSILSGGQYGFTYPVDDAYIHLSIARQLWESGSFSPQAGVFAMSSSSPGYSMLLALVGGFVNMPYWLPIILNSIAGIGVVWLAYLGWRDQNGLRIEEQGAKSEVRSLLLISAFIVLTPLPLLILNGMEHAWQLVANLWLFQLAGRALKNHVKPRRLILAAGLSTLFRYEGLFLAGGLFFFLILKKRFKEGFSILAGALLPVIIIGLYSLANDGTFLPLTLLGKGQSPWVMGIIPWFANGIQVLYENPFMFALLLGLLVIIIAKKDDSIVRFQAQALALACLPHIWMAQVGGYRYEAYLIGLGLYLILPFLYQQLSWKKPASWALALTWLFPFIIRAGFFGANHTAAVHDIAFQHRATASFLNTYYPGKPVVLNDIGTVCYETQSPVTDLNGISDPVLMMAKLNGTCTKAFIDSSTRARGAWIAAIHDKFVGEVIPDDWILVDRWVLEHSFITADPVLTWYAADSSEAKNLRASLQAFDNQ